MPLIEICVDSLDSALAAEAGGADRLELCSALSEGGLTPSAGLIRSVRSQVTAALHVMIRPRSGDFLYAEGDLVVMGEDIALARAEGADGIVLGVLTPDGQVDEEHTRHFVELAHPMQVTFHRAFDLAEDLEAALEALVRAGVHRVLTTGGARTAVEGQDRIAGLVAVAGQRLAVMVGGGVYAGNVAELAAVTRAREFHAALRRPLGTAMQYQGTSTHPGDPRDAFYTRQGVRSADVEALKLAAEGSGSAG